MIYCSCGGQKNCYKCDGKGWIDRTEADELKAIESNLPPVLSEYSKLPESSFENTYCGRRKPLTAQIYAATTEPRSTSAKSRKNHTSSLQILALLNEKKKTRKIKRKNGLTEHQSSKMAGLKRELANLIEGLPKAKDATEAVKLRIMEKERLILNLHIKAQKKAQKDTERG